MGDEVQERRSRLAELGAFGETPAPVKKGLASLPNPVEESWRQIQEQAAQQAMKTGKAIPQESKLDVSQNPYSAGMGVTALTLSAPVKFGIDTVMGMARIGQTAVSPVTGEAPSIDVNSAEGTAEVVMTGMGYNGASMLPRIGKPGAIDPLVHTAGGGPINPDIEAALSARLSEINRKLETHEGSYKERVALMDEKKDVQENLLLAIKQRNEKVGLRGKKTVLEDTGVPKGDKLEGPSVKTITPDDEMVLKDLFVRNIRNGKRGTDQGGSNVVYDIWKMKYNNPNMTNQQIADAMGMSKAAVQENLAFAVSQLKRKKMDEFLIKPRTVKSDEGIPPVDKIEGPKIKERQVIDFDLKQLTGSKYLKDDLDYSDMVNSTGQVIKNPSKSDLAKLSVIPPEMRTPNSGNRTAVRVIEDSDGNVYAWNGYNAIHYDMEQYLTHAFEGKFKSAREYYVEFGKDGKPYQYNEPDIGGYSVEDFGKPYGQVDKAPDTIGVENPMEEPSISMTDDLMGRRILKSVANENTKDVYTREGRMLQAAWEERLATVKDELAKAKEGLAEIKAGKAPKLKEVREINALIRRYEEMQASYEDALQRQKDFFESGAPDIDINTPEMDAQIDDTWKRLSDKSDAEPDLTLEQKDEVETMLNAVYPDSKSIFRMNRFEKAGVTENDLWHIIDTGIVAGPRGLEQIRKMLMSELEHDPKDARSSAMLQFLYDMIKAVVADLGDEF